MRYLFPLIVLLSGCVTPSGMEDMLAEWKGASLEEVVMQWGAPSDQVETGELVTYTWESSKLCPRRLTFKDGRVIAWSRAEDMALSLAYDCTLHRWRRPK